MRDNAFLFRDDLRRIYMVAWEGKASLLYVRTRLGHWSRLREVTDKELPAFMEREVFPEEAFSVRPIGRLFYMVQSESREDVCHVVDMEANVFATAPACSCEQNQFRHLKCKHIQAVEDYLAFRSTPAMAA